MEDKILITPSEAVDYVFSNCPDFELAWKDGEFDEERFDHMLNDKLRLEITSVCLGFGIYIFRLIQNEEQELVKQVALILEEIHQS